MRSAVLLALCLAAPLARAEVPDVVADIAPVQSLVARVMGDLGTPALIVRPDASPHGYALRPSEAAALERADAVFWVGEALEPWLAAPLETLARDARRVALLEAPGTELLERRMDATFASHDHAEDDHDAHGADDHADHDDHDAHGDLDPHAWLDPENGKAWLDAIAAELSGLDPENAATYAANAAAGKAEIDAVSAVLAAELAPLTDMPFLVSHDAFHYFEARFGLHALGSVAASDAADPGAARILELQQAIGAAGTVCFLAEPGVDIGAMRSLLPEGATVVELDPIFVDMAPGPDYYPGLISAIGAGLVACGED